MIDASVFGNAIHVLVARRRAQPRPNCRLIWSARTCAPTQLERIQPSLEDVFVRLIAADMAKRRHGGMKLRRLKAIAVKEVLQIWRDPRSLMIALLLPFTLMFLFGYGVNLDLKHIPVCTFDREGSQQSQDLFKHFQASLYFAIARNVKTYPEMVAAIDRGDCRLGIVVPPDFSERLNDAGSASVQAILDGTDDNTANIAWGYAGAVVERLFERRCGVGDRPAGPDAAANPAHGGAVAGLVQRGSGQPQLHRSRPGRRHHGAGRRAAHLAHHFARMGARHNGAV